MAGSSNNGVKTALLETTCSGAGRLWTITPHIDNNGTVHWCEMLYRRSGLVILVVSFVALLAGIAIAIGMAENTSYAFRVVGVFVVLGTGTALFLTARRWAGYFFALCGIACIKAALALVFGVSVAVPRLVVTDRQLVFEYFGLLGGMSILTFRFATTPPKSNLQALALVVAVVGLAWSMLIEPNIGPLIISIAAVAIAWIVQRFGQAFHGRRLA